MNIDFKESFFRFIFPGSLLWSLIILFDHSSFDLFTANFLPHQDGFSVVLILLFITTSVILNAISSLLMIPIINCKLGNLNDPTKEVNYWRSLASETERKADGSEQKSNIVERKVDRRWDFFTANFNSVITMLIFIIVHIFLWTNLTINSNICGLSVSIILLIVFAGLACRGYKYIKAYQEDIFK